MSEQKEKKIPIDVEEKVMDKIKREGIKMKSPFSFLVEKLGLEAALVVSIISGAVLFSITFHILRKIKVFKFLKLGFLGFKVFLFSLPVVYLILLVFFIFLAVYFAQKLDIPCQKNISCDRIAILFLMSSILIGCILICAGVHKMFGNFSGSKIPRNMAVSGKIEKAEKGDLWLKDEEGNLTEVFVEDEKKIDDDLENFRGKVLRAVGRGDDDGGVFHFHARNILCCDDD